MINIDNINSGLSMKYEFMCIIKYLEYIQAQQSVNNPWNDKQESSSMVYKIKTNMAHKGIVESAEKLFGFMYENRMKIIVQELQMGIKESCQADLLKFLQKYCQEGITNCHIHFIAFYDPSLFSRIPRIKNLRISLPVFKPPMSSISTICNFLKLISSRIQFDFDLYNGFAVDENNYIDIIQQVMEVVDSNSHLFPAKIVINVNNVPEQTIKEIWARFEGVEPPQDPNYKPKLTEIKRADVVDRKDPAQNLLRKYGKFCVNELPPMERRKIAEQEA